jgi:hypothetical protein
VVGLGSLEEKVVIEVCLRVLVVLMMVVMASKGVI